MAADPIISPQSSICVQEGCTLRGHFGLICVPDSGIGRQRRIDGDWWARESGDSCVSIGIKKGHTASQ